MAEVQVAFGMQASLPGAYYDSREPSCLKNICLHTVFTCEVYSVRYLIDCFACACFFLVPSLHI